MTNMESASRARYRARQRAGVAAVAEQMSTMLAQAADFSGAWAEIGFMIADRERKVFAETRSGAGRRWRPLKAETILRKRRMGLSTAPMVRTGSLLAELTNAKPVAEGRGFAVWGPRNSEIAHVGVRHKRGQGNAPQRDPAPPIRPREAESFLNIMRRHVIGV